VVAQEQRFGSVKKAPQRSGTKNLPPIGKIAKIAEIAKDCQRLPKLKNKTFETRRNGGQPGLKMVADITRHEADHVQHSLWCLEAVQ
jgi:hypothetical protein